MSLMNPTPLERLVDAEGRPYFLWDCDMTLDSFKERIRSGSRTERAYLLGKLMRQAKPDDVFQFTSLADIREHWMDLERYLGRTRPFWTWLLAEWGRE
jgi:hypothetical protein